MVSYKFLIQTDQRIIDLRQMSEVKTKIDLRLGIKIEVVIHVNEKLTFFHQTSHV